MPYGKGYSLFLFELKFSCLILRFKMVDDCIVSEEFTEVYGDDMEEYLRYCPSHIQEFFKSE